MQARKITPYVFVLTPLPVDESRTAPIPWRPAWSYTNSSISKFAAANATEAMRAGAILIDVARKFTPNKNQELLIDGVHPSKNGYDAMFQEIYQTLQQNKLVNL